MNFKKAIFIWVAAAFVTTNIAIAQVKKKTTTATTGKTAAGNKQTKPGVSNTTGIPTDPNVLVGKLPNGLTYYIRANGQPKGRAQLLLVTKAGSVLETDAQRGMANFIQHMAFEGTRDFPKEKLNAYLNKLGGRYLADSSAFTNYDETTYQLNVPTDSQKDFADGFSLLSNWAARINFDDAAVAKQKEILAAQAALGGKTPEDKLQQQTLPTLLNNSRYGMRLPIGTAAAIQTFTAAAAKSFYADWYRPDMQAVVAVGDFDPRKVEELIKFNFASLRNPVAAKPQPQFNAPATPGTVVKFATEKGFAYNLIQIITKHPQLIVKTQADILLDAKINIFSMLLSKRVSDLTKTPSSPIVFGQASYAEFIGKQDALSTLAVARDEQNLEAAVKAVMAEVERARKFGFTFTEVERAKQAIVAQNNNAYAAKGNIPSAGMASEYEHSFINKQAIPGIDFEYNFYINNITKITAEDINTLATKLITDQNRVILIEAPDTEKDKLPTEQTVLKWVAEAGNNLTAYVDDSVVPFMDNQPQGGKVDDIKIDSTISVINVRLSNGVKVILKPTHFTPNQILIAGYAFGGTSLASNDDFMSASIAAQAVSNSGVGQFDQGKLNRMMADKNFSITPYLGDISQGISGYAAPGDFDSAMQLLNLYFTAPRKDAGVWQNLISKSKSSLVKNANDPGTVYQDSILAVLGGYNPRAMPVTEAKLNTANLDRAYDFYKARFADASNFTFTFTGDFDPKELMPYLAIYLGGLPSTHSAETFKNLGMHPPTGQITKTITKGTGDKATVQLVYNGTYDYNDANNIQMDGLEEILNIRLVDSLKDGNGIYSPSATVSYLKNPEGRYKVTIAFLADANNVDKATAYMQGEIAKIKQNGPNSADVKLFIAREARTIQSQYKQNSYWQAALTVAAQNEQKPDRILARMQSLEQVTDQSAKDTANKYLNNNNLIKFILMPEKK